MSALLLAVIPDGMMIFYDGSEAPEGWEVVEDFAGRFPRACTPPGSVGGSEKHTHKFPDSVRVTMEGPCTGAWGPGGGQVTLCKDFVAAITEFDSASHVPPFRYLLVIRKVGDGILLPKGAILFFEDSVPAGWQPILPDSFPRAGDPEQVGETGGSYYHTHTYRIVGSPPESPDTSYAHWQEYDETFPAYSFYVDNFDSCGRASNLPPHVKVFIAELTQGPAEVPLGAIAMFDEEPRVGLWRPPDFISDGDFVMGTADSAGARGGSGVHWHQCERHLPNDYWEGDCYVCRVQSECDGTEYHINITLSYSQCYWSFRTNPVEVFPPYRCVLFRKYERVGVRARSGKPKEVRYGARKLRIIGYQGFTLRLYSSDGRLRLQKALLSNSETVSLKGFPTGVYFVKLGDELYKFSIP